MMFNNKSPRDNTPYFIGTAIARDYALWSVLVLLPGANAAYFILASILNYDVRVEALGAVSVLCLLIGLFLLMDLRRAHKDDKFDGMVRLDPDHENGITNVEVSISPEALESGQAVIRLEVKTTQ